MILNKRQLADAFGVAEETITQWQKAGMPIQTARKGTMGNEYMVADCIRWYALRESGGEGALDLDQQRARLAKTQADRAEMETAQYMGEIVHVGVLQEGLSRMFGNFRQNLLTMGDRLKTEIDALYGIEFEPSIIDIEVERELTELSRYDPSRMGSTEEDGEVSPAAGEDDDDGMGDPASGDVGQIDREAGTLQPRPDALGKGHARGAGRSTGT